MCDKWNKPLNCFFAMLYEPEGVASPFVLVEHATIMTQSSTHNFYYRKSNSSCMFRLKRPKHKSAIGFTVIKVVYRLTTSLLLRIIQHNRYVTPEAFGMSSRFPEMQPKVSELPTSLVNTVGIFRRLDSHLFLPFHPSLFFLFLVVPFLSPPSVEYLAVNTRSM